MLKIFDYVLGAIAATLAASLVASAWHDVSQAYDVWYYHLPFAARLGGLLDTASYAFSVDNQARFGGYPLLGEFLQGIAWRLTGHVAAANFVALGAVFAIPLVLRRLYGVSLSLSLIALLAIPLVESHATSCYVDLPANACVTLLLVLLHRAIVGRTVPSLRLLACAVLLAALAANMKFQVVPITMLALTALAVVSLRNLPRYRALDDVDRAALRRRLVLFACALPIVLATPLKNVAVHGNPVWPVELKVLGHVLPHVEKAYASSPPHLENAARPIRFLRSALEIDNRPISSHQRWSLDQWTPPDEPAYRMGGYFGGYVALNLLALGLAVWRQRTREARSAAGIFGVVTLVAALVPQSHELRYYMHWMLLLVALNLVLWARVARAAVGAFATAALAVVAWSTEGAYLSPSGKTISELVAARVDARVLDQARPGERVCVAKEPFTFLYAPLFHARKDYAITAAATPEECPR